jgi:hypothetical protein
VLAPAPPPVHVTAAPPAVVRLADCDTANRAAVFEGDMRTVKRTLRLQMRFTVQEKAAGPDQSWHRVQAPTLDQGLQPGVGYRVVVRFRWRSASGSVLRTVQRRSRTCRVPDPRPDLVPVSIAPVPGGYSLTIANKGHATAAASSASLDVGATALTDQDVPALDPGAHFRVTFSGPACAPGDTLSATVDATGLVDEAVEADDVLTVPCNGA